MCSKKKKFQCEDGVGSTIYHVVSRVIACGPGLRLSRGVKSNCNEPHAKPTIRMNDAGYFAGVSKFVLGVRHNWM